MEPHKRKRCILDEGELILDHSLEDMEVQGVNNANINKRRAIASPERAAFD